MSFLSHVFMRREYIFLVRVPPWQVFTALSQRKFSFPYTQETHYNRFSNITTTPFVSYLIYFVCLWASSFLFPSPSVHGSTITLEIYLLICSTFFVYRQLFFVFSFSNPRQCSRFLHNTQTYTHLHMHTRHHNQATHRLRFHQAPRTSHFTCLYTVKSFLLTLPPKVTLFTAPLILGTSHRKDTPLPAPRSSFLMSPPPPPLLHFLLLCLCSGLVFPFNFHLQVFRLFANTYITTTNTTVPHPLHVSQLTSKLCVCVCTSFVFLLNCKQVTIIHPEKANYRATHTLTTSREPRLT